MKASSAGILLGLLCVSCGSAESGVRVEATSTAPALTQSGGAEERARPAVASAKDEAPSLAWRGARAGDWLSWRGPHQNGTSDDACPAVPRSAEDAAWSVPISGRGTPVIADGLVYAMGYQGEDATCIEMLVCLDERDGSILWQKLYPDFLSDVVYSRYSISSPTIDPETGNVYVQTSPGRLIAYARDGKELWEHSLMEEYGKLTFPNGRTGAPLVVGDRVIVHIISSSWGPLGPARDRFYAFDKKTGVNLWSATPGEMPQDNSFSFPIVFEQDGRMVIAAETGCGFLAALDVATGDPLWRHRIGSGANSSPVLSGDTLIGVHGNENFDDSSIGRMVGVKLGALPAPGAKQTEVGKEGEKWRVDIEAFSSSPVLAGNRIYQTDEDGELACIDAEAGKLLWKHKLAPDQVHASPLFAEGKLFVPMNNGSLHIVAPKDAGPEVLASLQLEGNCLGAPALSNTRLYVHTTDRLYCFGVAGDAAPATAEHARPFTGLRAVPEGTPGEAVRLQLVPADVAVEAGESVTVRARTLDALGRVVADPAPGVTFTTTLPLKEATPGTWSIAADAPAVAGALEAASGALKAAARVRIVPSLPYVEDFEKAKLDQKAWDDPALASGFAPSSWLGARVKWDVREREGSKVLARIIDNPLFQRTITLIGGQHDRNYTVQADLSVEGNRRGICSAGLINQRYLIQLKGNHKQLEVSSNFESLKVAVPFEIEAGQWYTLESRVDAQPDGSTIVRARCWKRGDSKPDAWTIEVPHAHGHLEGAAGLYGFTPMSRFKVYVDNLKVTPNE